MTRRRKTRQVRLCGVMVTNLSAQTANGSRSRSHSDTPQDNGSRGVKRAVERSRRRDPEHDARTHEEDTAMDTVTLAQRADHDFRPRREWPVFIIGCHRSGTTLARYILDALPDVSCPPESKFIAGLEAFVNYPQALHGLGSLGVTTDDIFDELRAFVVRVFDRYAQQRQKRRWIDKTPNYYRLLPFIDRIFNGRVLYLCMVRHPLDTVESLRAAEAFNIERPEDPDIAQAVRQYGTSRAAWAHYWLTVNARLSVFVQNQRDRCHIFRYEDLVLRPEDVVPNLLRFIECDIPDDILRRAFTESHTAGYGDWKIRHAQGVYRTQLDKWRRWPDQEVGSLWEIVGQLAIELGYDKPTDAPWRDQ
jgi:protein-tyrosine sulfotransferase